MANKTKTSGMLLTSITMVILIITSSATGLIITKQNWKKFLKDHPLALILCYSSIHGPSMVLKEDLEDSSHLLAFENNKIRVGYLDVHSHPDTFPQASNASEIPFISFYFHKKHFILTKPNLTYDKIRHFCRTVIFKHTFKQLKTLSDLQNLPKTPTPTILYTGPKHSHLLHSLIDWSTGHHIHTATYVYCCTDEAASHDGGRVSARQPHAAAFDLYDRPWHAYDFDSWLTVAGRPVVDRLDADGYGRVVVHGYPTLVVFVENDAGEDDVRVKAGIEAVAQKVRSKLGVAICNRQRDQMCQKLMEKVEVYSEELPQLIVVHWPDQEHSDFYLKYLFDENKITENTLFAFLLHYQRGFVDPYVRTEAEEDMKDQIVWKLVGTDISRRIKFGKKRTQDIVVLFHLGDTDPLSAKVLQMVHWTANKLASEDSIQLASYNYRLNTRAGLALTNKTTPFLRIYRMDDEEHFSDRDFRDDPNWILHFVIDHATQDISLQDEVSSTETDL